MVDVPRRPAPFGRETGRMDLEERGGEGGTGGREERGNCRWIQYLIE